VKLNVSELFLLPIYAMLNVPVKKPTVLRVLGTFVLLCKIYFYSLKIYKRASYGLSLCMQGRLGARRELNGMFWIREGREVKLRRKCIDAQS
jgi:hypothetical protein